MARGGSDLADRAGQRPDRLSQNQKNGPQRPFRRQSRQRPFQVRLLARQDARQDTRKLEAVLLPVADEMHRVSPGFW